MINQTKKNDERFWKRWKRAGAIGDINGRDFGRAYAFFDCNASREEINEILPDIRDAVKTPKKLELSLVEEALSFIGYNPFDPELFEISREASEAKIRYALRARAPSNMTNSQTADELAAILNQAYQSPLYQDKEPFRGWIFYKEKGKYVSRD